MTAAETEHRTAAPGAAQRLLRVAAVLLLAAAVLLIGHYARAAIFNPRSPRRPFNARARAARTFDGEAGMDPRDVPPPPLSRRIKTHVNPRARHHIIVHYLSDAHRPAVAAFYGRRMAAHGWTERPTPAAARLNHPGTLLYYSNDSGDSCIISVTGSESHGTRVSILRRRGPRP